jgi:hypothetical protein
MKTCMTHSQAPFPVVSAVTPTGPYSHKTEQAKTSKYSNCARPALTLPSSYYDISDLLAVRTANLT